MDDHLIDNYCDMWRRMGITQALIRQRNLPLFNETHDLEIVEPALDESEFLLTPNAARAWIRMKRAAERDNIAINIVSAFRSVQRQSELIVRKLESGEPLERVLEVLAPPGCSEHHTGNAVDLGSREAQPLDPAFESTAAFQWLKRNASLYGFTLSFPKDNPFGYVYEPWHWCYSGVDSQHIVSIEADNANDE
jgi:D-alanyl-D-alanine carboxypeptidase